MKDKELFNMQKSIIIGATDDISPRIRSLIFLARQSGAEIYVNHPKEDDEYINIELKELLAEYGFDYKYPPIWVNDLIPEALTSGSIIICKDNKYIGYREYNNDHDFNIIFDMIFNESNDNMELVDENLIEGKILVNINNDELFADANDGESKNGIRNYVKKMGHNRKNRY